MNDVLVMILAGGQGTRLRPLTTDRAKPAVPFGGRYRIVDFVLSNFVNSGFYKIKVLTQYKSDSLNIHLSRGWRLDEFLGHFIDAVPAQQRRGPHWFAGSADAIYQSLNHIEDVAPHDICVFGADHIYHMDVRQMVRFHREKGADLTVAAIPVPLEEGYQFGIIEVDERHRIIGFQEKPTNPTPIPGKPNYCLASMGNYIFRTPRLIDEVIRDAKDEASDHDFGGDIVTHMVSDPGSNTMVYDFSTNSIPGNFGDGVNYWRDVGTLKAYWEASMDLVSVDPEFDLYNPVWPIRSHYKHFPPAKFVHDDPSSERIGTAIDSIVAEGCIISGGTIRRSVLFPRVHTHSYSLVEDSVLFEGVDVGRRARLRRTIVDKDVQIPPETSIGFDLESDRERFTVSKEGIVVIPKGFQFQ